MRPLHPAFAPRSRFIALEARVLFDGAAAVAVEQQNAGAEAQEAAAPPKPAATLVVIDGRLNNATELAAELTAAAGQNARVLLVGQSEDGLAALTQALTQAGEVDAIQIYSHGAAGQFSLGSRTLSADNIAAASPELQSWASHLSADADILLLGCNVGSGQSGQALVNALAAATGADVAASTNDTGSTAAGGDWALERATGSIESRLPTLHYEGLLANASPTVALSGSSMDSLLGGQFSFTATFTNATSAQEGYSPFMDIILPATGKDGAGAEVDDGITFVSATYLGQTVKSYVLTFDASGNATHPLAKDSAGLAIVVTAASFGAQAGDQLVVLQLPYSSVINGQPNIPVVVTCQLSDLADTTGSPDLTIKARGGFQYGNDSADNPATDPSLIEVGTHDLVIHPTGLQLTQSLNTPEGETVTGPNFARSLTVTATPPPGQTLTNVDITQSLPNTIRVSAITPGAGGTITSITVGTQVITGPALISSALALSPYLTSYTVRYASLTAPADTVVSFYVPEIDAAGASVLDPVTGDARSITLGTPTATGKWLPLDTRDQTVDAGPPITTVPADITASGNSASFVAKSIALRKTVSVASDTGSTGLSPGDTLQYTLNVDLSDYFAMGKTLFNSGSLVISDQLGDGQRLIGGSAQMTVFVQGATYTLALVSTTGTPGVGGTALSFDIAQSLANTSAIFGGALIGDVAYDGLIQGATRAVITYRSTVDQAYTTAYTQSEINEGDAIGNNATVSGSFLANYILLTGDSESDTSSASLSVPTHNVSTSILSVNGAAAPSSVELKPGDVVVFKLAYDLQTSDYEQLKLSAYLPLPLFDLGTSGSTWSAWSLGAGNTNADAVDSVTVGAGNSLIFNFGSHATSATAGSRVEVQFTLTVGNKPFADQRALTVLGQSDQLTTVAGTHLQSSGVVNIVSVAEPVLTMSHGVVGYENGGGVITDSSPISRPITDTTEINGNIINIDAGDVLDLVTTIKNSGGLGAFDVTSTVTLPAGLSFAGSGGALANSILGVYRGNLSTTLVSGVDYSITGNTITFLDAGGIATLKEGRTGTANDLSGDNVVVIIYRVKPDSGVATSQSFQTTATLTHYSSTDGGPDFTPSDLSDTATETMAAPTITKGFANGSISDDDSSASHTTGTDLVVGESMLYDIIVTLPEGVTQNLRVTDLVPAGMTLDTSFGSGAGYQIITTTAGSAALVGGDFNGSLTVGSATTPVGDGADLTLTFSTASVVADNGTQNNAFVIRVRLIASDVSGNQAGVNLANSAQLVYSDPDGDTANGSTPLDRNIALSDSLPGVTVREPTLVIAQSYTIAGPGGDPNSVVKDDVVTYTFTLTNNSASSDFNAFDISFSDTLPTLLGFSGTGLGLLTVTSAGGATATLGDFTISGGVLQSVGGANIDIPKGGSVTIVIAGQVLAPAASVPNFSNTASAQWTSLDGTVSGERTGADGLLNSGALNDYRVQNTATVNVASGSSVSHVGGLADTPGPTPATDAAETVAVGEIIRYRVAARVVGGVTVDSNFVIDLPEGLSFIKDGTTTVGLVGNSNSTLFWSGSPPLTATGSGPYFITGGLTNRAEALLPSDPTTSSVTAVLNADRINITDPRAVQVSLDQLTNNENFDSDAEAIYIEFNVRVDNISAVDTSKSFAVSAKYQSGSTVLSTTNTVLENIVEPNLTNIQKVVTDFDPRTSLTTGIATVTVDFSNSGDGIAYEAHLADTMSGGSNYALSKVIIGGTTYLPGSLPAGVTVTTSGGIAADFSTVAIGTRIQLVYTVEVSNSVAVASTNAVLTWSSLPESFTTYLGSGVGVDNTANGERLYSAQEGAGLGIISGSLWDDTASATSSSTADGTALAGQNVTLVWAGADGDLATSADNRSYTATTDASGNYHFGVLPSGNFRVDGSNIIASYVFGADTDRVVARVDSDAGTLASVTLTALGEAASGTANIGYVRDNDAPVNSLPAAPTTLEDTLLNISGISIADVDAGAADMSVKLTVLHGTVNLTTTGLSITAGALNTATVTLRGSASALNTALTSLQYMPSLNYNGTDTLSIVTNDLGNTGDANNNLTPNESGDALSDTDTLTLNITAVNDAPTGVNDAGYALEKGGVNNTVEGLPAGGNVLTNDTDVDIATNNDRLSVSEIGFASNPRVAVAASGFTSVIATYGTLSIDSAGNAKYIIDDANTAVQALRLSSNTLTETFTYQLRDIAGDTATATITVTLRGANDTPIATNDEGTATEAGGVANASGGADATGNVLSNDTDVDANSETKAVSGVRAKRESEAGVMTGVATGTPGVIVGSYGTLTMNADGSYSYAVDQSAAAVQRLVSGDTLIEYFSYAVSDALGDADIAELKITINGANDNPVASNDVAVAQAASTSGSAMELNPTGNVILIQSRPGTSDNGLDTDVDRTDQPSSLLTVTGIRTGNEAAVATLTTVAGATNIVGTYGTLTINLNGSYSYDVDSTNATLMALTTGGFVTETFTYRLSDTAALTDLAELNITVKGVNDPPVGGDVFTTAIEKGGIADATLGSNATGDVLTNDFDPDGDALSVTTLRTGAEGAGGAETAVPTSIVGSYGTLTLAANGTYTYVIDNSLAAVKQLRSSSNTLTDTFTYRLSDNASTPETDLAQITVTLQGQNDNPLGINDSATAVEAGGVANGIAGLNPSGNVLSNDTDDDAYSETKEVSAVRSGAESSTGTAGTLGSELRGDYGWLKLNTDGSYTYRVDNDLAAVQALRTSGNTLSDSFTYTVRDAALTSDLAELVITIQGANDTPVAGADTATAVEAGGIANATVGSNPTGNVLSNDSDVDTNGESKIVSAFSNSASVAGTVGSALAGTYGSLTLNADGSYSYVLDNSNATVQALRTSSNTLTETFNYTMRDAIGAVASSTLTLTLRGANDNPIGINDAGTAVEAGGTFNATAGSDATGTVLSNDTDVDSVTYGETKLVSAVRTGAETGSGTTGSVGSALIGTYGSLTLNASGSYTYVVDNNNAAVQALRGTTNTLSETFTYTLRDTAGATDLAQLVITIRGANDAPVAVNEGALAWPAIIGSPSSGRNPTGNVLSNDTDVDSSDSKVVSGARAGTESAGGSLTSVAGGSSSSSGPRINGSYGWLSVGSDGSYLYEVDPLRTASLAASSAVQDFFTYAVRDTAGLTDLAQLSVTVRGKNDPPVAQDVATTAIEAGGIANGTLGLNPAGDAVSNDSDAEGDALSITAIRTGAESGSGTAGSVGSELRGNYGWLTIQTNGTYTYRVDNDLAAVQALRGSGNTLTDSFTYTVADPYAASDRAAIVITIQGANDTPVTLADTAIAAEAGGVFNATPGSNATGNVLSNDTDVDAYGETKTVAALRNSAGTTASVGSALAGLYGSLTLNADGSFSYAVDNNNAAVEALRTPAQTLTETYIYTVSDATGASTTATLTLTIRGANDTPVAVDDTAQVSDAGQLPITTGNVLANDTDIDTGDTKTVVAIRTGSQTASGTSGLVGVLLNGTYGTLILNADGSYRYEVDLSRPAVMAVAGLGPILTEYFTYTVTDTAGATTQATLAIKLDINAPYTGLPASRFRLGQTSQHEHHALNLGFEPIIYVERVVDAIQHIRALADRRNEGADPRITAWPEIKSVSPAAGIAKGILQPVRTAVLTSQAFSAYDASRVNARESVVSLSADGLLQDVSLFRNLPASIPASTPANVADPTRSDSNVTAPKQALSSPSFTEQLRQAARQNKPLAGLTARTTNASDKISRN